MSKKERIAALEAKVEHLEGQVMAQMVHIEDLMEYVQAATPAARDELLLRWATRKEALDQSQRAMEHTMLYGTPTAFPAAKTISPNIPF